MTPDVRRLPVGRAVSSDRMHRNGDYIMILFTPERLDWWCRSRSGLAVRPGFSFLVRNPRPDSAPASRRTFGGVDLKKGTRGDAVSVLQSRLNAALGASLVVDGVFGMKTQSAVKQLQRRQGLQPDGVVGSRTKAALRVP